MAQLFTKQAGTYALSRAIYPPSLFSFLASLTPHHALAWDVGTGNGQAAIQVPHFPHHTNIPFVPSSARR